MSDAAEIAGRKGGSSNGTTGEAREAFLDRRAPPWVIALIGLAVAACAFLMYSGSLRNDFVWDDPIVLNQQLQAFHSIRDAFFPPPRIPQFGQLYYRPLITVSYMLDRYLWGDTPFGFHFPVVLLHAMNSALVFFVGRRLFGDAWAAVLAALGGAALFVTHPIHTESVCWMAGRSDTLAAAFLLPALLAYLAWKRRQSRWPYLVLAMALFLGGCLVKESAFGLLLLIVAGDLLGMGEKDGFASGAPFAARGRVLAATGKSSGASGDRSAAQGAGANPGRRESRRAARSTGPARGRQRSREPSSGPPAARERVAIPIAGWVGLAVASGAYYALRIAGLAEERSSLRPQETSLVTSALNLIRAVGFYISKIVVPTHLDAYIPEVPSPGFALLLGFVSLGGAAAAAWLLWVRREKLTLFLLTWFFAALAPSLAIAYFTISEAPVAERYLYLPSAGFCLLVAYLAFLELPARIPRALRSQAVAGALLFTLAVSAVYAGATLQRERVWKSDFEFWKDGVAKSPREGLPHLHLGLAYANQNKDDLAEREYLEAIDPTRTSYDVEGRSTALNNLGMLYMGKKDFVKADDYFQQAIQQRPDYATPHYGIGVTSLRRAEELYRQNRSAEAMELFRRSETYLQQAIRLNPQYTKAHNQLGYLFLTLGRKSEGLEHLNRVIQLVSRGPEHDFAASLIQQAASRP